MSKKDPLLNLRDEPSAKAKIRARLPNGTVLASLQNEGKWIEVKLAFKGTEFKGWVSTKFVRKVREPGECVKFC